MPYYPEVIQQDQRIRNEINIDAKRVDPISSGKWVRRQTKIYKIILSFRISLLNTTDTPIFGLNRPYTLSIIIFRKDNKYFSGSKYYWKILYQIPYVTKSLAVLTFFSGRLDAL